MVDREVQLLERFHSLVRFYREEVLDLVFVLLGFASRSAKETAALAATEGEEIEAATNLSWGFCGLFCFRFFFVPGC